MYYMGTWEVGTFTDPSLDPEVAKNIDFFTLPTTDGATTQTNEYIAPSGIGMAVNAKKYDPVGEDFIKFLIAEYPARYAAKQQFSPLVAPALTEGLSELYTKSSAALDQRYRSSVAEASPPSRDHADEAASAPWRWLDREVSAGELSCAVP